MIQIIIRRKMMGMVLQTFTVLEGLEAVENWPGMYI